MTYNFDPDGWYEMQMAALAAKRERGEISDSELESDRAALQQRYEEMLDRLDGTYQIPSGREK